MTTTSQIPTKPEVLGLSVLGTADGREPAKFPQARMFRAANPATGEDLPTVFHAATREDLDAVCKSAWRAFYAMADRSREDRAKLLDACASHLADLGDDLIKICAAETGLGPARLVSERERAVNTLRMFAAMVREGSWVRASIDHGDAARRPLPKPDLRRMLRPLGPVAVFGASNFPLAYSTGGGDTASAFAAGCPVVVKGHPSHPGTGELVARAIARAVTECGFDPGTFSFLHAGGERETEVGLELIRHSCIRAVGFTGSLAAGTAIAKEAAARPDPIPVFAEMGSVNPVFLLPEALTKEPQAVADRLYASITNSAGQFCTCPGLLFAVRCDGLEPFLKALSESMNQAGPMVLLNRRIRAGFAKRAGEIAAVSGVEVRAGVTPGTDKSELLGDRAPVRASAVLFRTSFATYRQHQTLREECFGPEAVVVVCQNEDELLAAAASIHGSLTGSIFATGLDLPLALRVQAALEQRVGRLVYNGVPTGVEVCTSMVHGGPYPATNQAHSTAQGPLAVERWCRPVAFQNAPASALPLELRDENPMKIVRVIDGRLDVPGLRK